MGLNPSMRVSVKLWPLFAVSHCITLILAHAHALIYLTQSIDDIGIRCLLTYLQDQLLTFTIHQLYLNYCVLLVYSNI